MYTFVVYHDRIGVGVVRLKQLIQKKKLENMIEKKKKILNLIRHFDRLDNIQYNINVIGKFLTDGHMIYNDLNLI